MRTPHYAALAALAALSACDPTSPPSQESEGRRAAEPPPEARPSGAPRLRTVYVPAYSYLPRSTAADSKKFLSIVLSVRNVDSEASVTLTHVDYFDTQGHRVRRYLDAPRTLRPLETVEYSVAAQDTAGGSGANFLVYWEGPADAHALLTEAVMYGSSGPGYLSFTSRGVELDRRPRSALFGAERVPDAGDAGPDARAAARQD